MRIPEEIITLLCKEKKILIATHINPDGDAIGSALALSDALESIGKKTFVYNRDPVPKLYGFMPGYTKFSSDIRKMSRERPVLILLDCNSAERASIERYRFRRSVVIDHHETETDFGDIRWIDRKAAATGVLVFHLIKALGIKLTRNISTNLYAAIAFDTGTFRYSNTDAAVLKTGAELIKSGAEPYHIANALYEKWSRKRFNLLLIMLDSLEIRNGIAIAHITRDMFKKTGTRIEDTENFVNFPMMIDSVMMSAIFREIGSGIWKASLRSKGALNAAKIAELFGGGGHKNAAGFKIKADIESAKAALIKTSKKAN